MADMHINGLALLVRTTISSHVKSTCSWQRVLLAFFFQSFSKDINLTICIGNPETESSNNQYRKSRNDYSSHDEPFNAKTKMLDAALTAFASIVVLGTGFALGGYLYHRFYKWMVIHKMEIAFKPGDPVLDLAATTKQMPKRYAVDDDDDDDEHWFVHKFCCF